jgi:hypothetical protein
MLNSRPKQYGSKMTAGLKINSNAQLPPSSQDQNEQPINIYSDEEDMDALLHEKGQRGQSAPAKYKNQVKN